jgi:hypothetical protein
MLSRVQLSDPGQQQMAGVISQMMAGVQARNKSGNTVKILLILSQKLNFFNSIKK